MECFCSHFPSRTVSDPHSCFAVSLFSFLWLVSNCELFVQKMSAVK